jgi:hypothetical protein
MRRHHARLLPENAAIDALMNAMVSCIQTFATSFARGLASDETQSKNDSE